MTYIAPGVYIQERDFSDYVAGLQGTSVAMVGVSRKGPINTPTLITSIDQFMATFGEPSVTQYAPLAAINYLRRGNILWFNRVARVYVDDVALPSAVAVIGAETVFTVALNHGIVFDQFIRVSEIGKRTSYDVEVTATTPTTISVLTASLNDTYTNAVRIGRPLNGLSGAAASAEVFGVSRRNGSISDLVKFTAINPGIWANFGANSGLEIVIEDGGQFANVDPATGLPFQSASGVDLQGILPSAPSVDTKLDLISLTSTAAVVGETRGVAYDVTTALITSITPALGTTTVVLPAGHGIVANDSITVFGADTLNSGTFTVVTSDPTTITYLDAAPGATQAGPLTGVYLTKNEAPLGVVYRCLTATVTGSTWSRQGVLTKRVRIFLQGKQVEVFDNLIGFDSDNPNFWDTVINGASKLVTVQYLASGQGEQPINTYNRVKHTNNPRLLMGAGTSVRVSDSNLASSVSLKNPKGIDGEGATTADFIGVVTLAGAYSGLQHFLRTELYDINMLCVPAQTSGAVVQEIIAICEARGDCLGIIDPPMSLTPQGIVDWHNGTGVYADLHSAFVSNKAALFYPWVKQFEPYTRREIYMPPSAIIPGIIAHSDSVSEQWYAPAGIDRGTVPNALGVEYQVTQGDVEHMYGPGNGNAVNAILQFARDGVVVYGQRTLQRTPSSLDRINVRRLLFFIEKSVAGASRRLAFEQNDPALWNRFVALVTPFLQNLRGRRALEWFQVVCNESTNPPDRRNNNEMGAKIYLIPVKTAEKIVLDFTLLASGTNVSEFIAQDTGDFTG